MDDDMLKLLKILLSDLELLIFNVEDALHSRVWECIDLDILDRVRQDLKAVRKKIYHF